MIPTVSRSWNISGVALALGMGLALLHGSWARAQAPAPAAYDVVAPASWVEVLPVPTPRPGKIDASQGAMRYVLVDRQVRFDGARYSYLHLAVRLLTTAGVDAVSQIKIEFDPQRERLHVHSVVLHRGGRSIDQLKAGRTEILRRESGLEDGLIDGQLTFHMLLNDVRVGDVVEYSYTLERSDPEWGERHYGVYTTRWDVPVDFSRLRISAREGAPLYFKNHDSVQPVRRTVDGWETVEWTWKDMPAMTTFDDAPVGFEQHPSVEVSQFADWKELARAAVPLFAVPAAASPERTALLARLRAAGEGDAVRLLAAIRFVQEDIRYTGIELGQGAYRPRPPDEVLAKRYGDCKDKSLLAVALLRDLGIEAEPVLVSTRWQRHLGDRLASPASMNHVIVRVRVGDATYWFDVTRTAQGGDLAHFVQADLGMGLVVAPATVGLTEMPRATAEVSQIAVSEIYDFSAGVDREGGLAVATLYRGAEADQMRQRMRNTTLEALAQDYLNYYRKRYDSIHAVGSLQVKDDPQTNELTLVEAYRIEHPFTQDRKGRMAFEVNGFLATDRLQAPAQPARTIPLGLDSPVNVTHQIVVRMPEPWPVKDEYESIVGPGFRFDSSTGRSDDDVHLDFRYRTFADQVLVGQLAEFLAKRQQARDYSSFTLSYDPHPAVTTDDIAKADAALEQAGELAKKGDTAKATQTVQTLMKMPAFASLDADKRHAAVFLAGALAFDQRDWEQAIGYLQQSSTMDDATAFDWELRLRTAMVVGNQGDAAQSLAEIARRWPDKLRALDLDLISAVVRLAPQSGTLRYGLLKALNDAHYEPPGQDLSWWWLELGRRQLERGEREAAVETLHAVTTPYALIEILADDRFTPVRAQLGTLDVAAAAERRVNDTRAASAREPRQLEPFVAYVSSLLDEKRYDAALRELDAVIASVKNSTDHGGYGDYDRQFVWVLDTRSRALQGLGRWDEAVAQLIEASHLPESGSDNVSQVINLAGLYNEIGRPREALAALAGLADGQQSPYGRMQVANESLGAAVQLGDTAAVERHLGYLRDHQSDSPRTYQAGLVRANRLDDAAALLLSRLSNPDQRSDALMDVQDFAHGAQTERDLEFLQRWKQLLARPDVAAGIRKVGTVGSYPILGVAF